jgi:hypothetical protein
MNPKFLDQNLFAEYEAMFVGHEEAWDFLKISCEYYEHIDDLVDEEVTTVDVKETTSLAACTYNHPYWRKHGAMLYLVDRIIHCQYFDSAMWESSEEEWKRRDAKALSHAGINMVFAVILLEFGQDTLDKFSLKFREHAHLLHIKDTI